MMNILIVIMMVVGIWPATGGGTASNQYTGGAYNVTPPQQQYQPQSQYPVYYVYPAMSMINQVSPSNAVPINPNYLISQEEKNRLLQKALDQAWEQYGPKSKQRLAVEPTGVIIPGEYSHRATAGSDNINNQEHSFQPWKSEWDEHVTLEPPAHREVLQPGFFNRLLASYIDFEVNYHEVADFVRLGVFVVFIGVLVLLWISVGVYIGLFPLKWLYFLGVGRQIDAEGRVGNHDGGNDLMTQLTDRIFLALDGDWLKKLEERLKKDGNRNWLTQSVQCCILPDAKTKGMADCQLVLKKARKQNAFTCLSDLIYNFQFGPTVTNNKKE